MPPSDSRPTSPVEQPRIPRWRGFNLTEMVSADRSRPFLESDFAWIAELGFDFVRLPLSYWCWSHPKAASKVDERALAWIDQAIDHGRAHGIHTCLSLHRIPGYCVNGRELEPFDLFEGPPADQARALEAAARQWQLLADRYRGMSNERLSFDLMNEPPWMESQVRYVEIVRALVRVIRDRDPDRLVVVDGADIGQRPVLDIVDLGVVQSTRGYLPKAVSHCMANWVPRREFEAFHPPTWPLLDDRAELWNAERLRRELLDPWQPLLRRGVPVYVGEWGAYNRTPHEVTLAWMKDLLALWKESNWGWAMWNLRGSFGIIDSQRPDVRYQDFHGHQLDRRMLELLLES